MAKKTPDKRTRSKFGWTSSDVVPLKKSDKKKAVKEAFRRSKG